MSDDMNFALINWIKKDQEERRQHQAKMVKRNERDDQLYLGLIKELIKLDIKAKDRQMIANFLRHKKEGKNWSPAQRSVITNIYYKYQ